MEEINIAVNGNDYRLVTTVAGIKEYIGDAKVVAFDYETAPDDIYREEDKAALDPWRSHIVGCSFSVAEHTGIYVPIAHLGAKNVNGTAFWKIMKGFLETDRIVKVAHNIAFESKMSYHRGIVIQPPVYDTICAAQLSLKNDYEFRRLSDSGLKKLAAELCGEPLPSFTDVTDGRHFDELDPEDYETVRYGCADSDFALRLYHIWNDWFDRFIPRHRYLVEEIESPTAVFVGLMSRNGVPMDIRAMMTAREKAIKKIDNLKAKMEEATGGVKVGSNCSTAAFKKYLYETLGLPVLKRTEKDAPSTDDEALLLLKDYCQKNKPDQVELFDLVLEYRKWQKIKSTYLDGYIKNVNVVSGRIHPDLMQLATDTGRFACRNPNLQNCYDDRTEILTRRGFVLFKDLTPEDEVAQWESGDIYFVKPEAIIEKDYQGEMVAINNQHIDLLVTPEHRCLLQDRKNNQYRVVPAKEYLADAKQLCAGQFAFGTDSLRPEEITLLVATQADGYLHGNCISFSFEKARKHFRLMNAVNALGIPYSGGVKASGQVGINLQDCETVRLIRTLLGEDKTWGPWLLDYDRRTVKQILEELPHWDGCFTRGNHYSSSIEKNADWMQILYVLTGTRTHKRKYWNGNPNSVDNYQLDITDRDYSLTSNAKKEIVPYEGRVYCVTVPSSFIMVRRNGQVCISGNSPQPGQDVVGTRNFITAPEGYKLMEADYSQAEIRLCAYLSQDQVLLDAYKNGVDVHAITTSAVFGISMEEAMDHSNPEYKHRRTVAKGTMFGIMYGIGAMGLSRNLYTNAGVRLSKQDCEGYIDGILNKYRSMAAWQNDMKYRARKFGYIETAMGRRRYLPGIKSDDYRERSTAQRMAINTPVQGLGADCLKYAMSLLVKGLKDRPYIQPVLTVHDSIVFLVREDKVKEAAGFVKGCMEAVPPVLKNFPPLVAEVSVGDRYGEME